MQVLDQADVRRDHIQRDPHLAGDRLVSCLGVVPCLGVVSFVSDVPHEANAAVAYYLGGATRRQNGAQVVGLAVVLNNGAVCIGASV
ncbi:hypothetical protein D3C76_1711980 [compost metagenome]